MAKTAQDLIEEVALADLRARGYTPQMLRQVTILREVLRERERQEFLKMTGRFRFTCADPELSVTQKLAVLAEEFGEVARASLEDDKLCSDVHGMNLRKELIQVAAVCVAWIESIDKRTKG